MRVACLDLPALPLQLVWRREPELRSQAVVVIDEDRPQGSVVWACERARAAGVLPGQRYAHALGLHRELRARLVAPEIIEAAIVELRTALHALSPRVEPAETGTFWLDGDGLQRIFDSATAWGMKIQQAIVSLGLAGAVVVGFSRFATYAIARATREGITVLRSDADERTAASFSSASLRNTVMPSRVARAIAYVANRENPTTTAPVRPSPTTASWIFIPHALALVKIRARPSPSSQNVPASAGSTRGDSACSAVRSSPIAASSISGATSLARSSRCRPSAWA